jgi:hypothetical protein
MRVKKKCRYCPDLFTPDPRSYRSNPDGKGRRSSQKACPKPQCQRQRHREACENWHAHNPAYDDDRDQERQRRRQKHRAYMRNYRAAYPDYVQDNREKQRERDAKRRNLVNRDAIELFSVGKTRRLINLVRRDAIRTPPIRVSEEICRQMERANRLVKRDVIALQKRIEQNRGHEKPTCA